MARHLPRHFLRSRSSPPHTAKENAYFTVVLCPFSHRYDNVDWKLSITPDMLDNIAVKELADMIASLPEIIDNLLADRWRYIPK